MRAIPTFIVNGFLESGKTTYIEETVTSDNFYKNGKTLIITCEFGEVEYNLEKLKNYNTVVREIEKVEDINKDVIEDFVRIDRPQRIVIEMNGMWDLTKIKYPRICMVCQQITMIDANSFSVYYNNMRQKVSEMIRGSEVVIFNRCEDEKSLANFKRSLMMINKDAMYAFQRTDGSFISYLEDELPFNVNADVIEIEDNDYAVWYMDTFDNLDRYLGKQIVFNAIIYTSPELPKNTFIPGRSVMNCCAEDIQFYGHLAYNDLGLKLNKGDWYHIVCTLDVSYNNPQKQKEIVIHPILMKQIAPLKKPVIS